jgi:hypothetical protein
MTDAPLPSDYSIEDGFSENGMEKCPHCEQQFGGESGHHGTVYDQQGREYEYFLNTDSGKGPFFCPECWPELEANRNAEQNHGLGDFA